MQGWEGWAGVTWKVQIPSSRQLRPTPLKKTGGLGAAGCILPYNGRNAECRMLETWELDGRRMIDIIFPLKG